MEPSDETPYPDGHAGLRAQVIPGGSKCLFEILGRRGQPLAHVALETPEVDQLMQRLAELRAAMNEAVPAALDPGVRLVLLVDPAWQLKPLLPGKGQDGAVLALRHPGLGWLGFLLPQSKVAALGHGLVQLGQQQMYRLLPATVTFSMAPPVPSRA